MANNCLQFSEVLEYKTKDEKQWLEGYLADENNGTEFKYQFEETHEKGVRPKKGSLWIYADESGDLDHVAALVSSFYEHFNISEPWTLTYATTCSKQRAGEFSGGGFIVLPGGLVKWATPEDFFRVEKENLKK